MSIELTDEIRNKHFSSPIRSEDIKYYTEYFALTVLRYCYDDFDDWNVSDAPDLQNSDSTEGIEVTELTINLNKAIIGDCLHYWETGDPRYKNKAECRGATAGDSYYILPAIDSNDELSALETIFRKKLEKLKKYKGSGFRKMGLIIIMDGLPLPSTSENWADVVRVIQSAYDVRYDTVYFTYTSVLSCYNCTEETTDNVTIDKSDYNALKKFARIKYEKK